MTRGQSGALVYLPLALLIGFDSLAQTEYDDFEKRNKSVNQQQARITDEISVSLDKVKREIIKIADVSEKQVGYNQTKENRANLEKYLAALKLLSSKIRAAKNYNASLRNGQLEIIAYYTDWAERMLAAPIESTIAHPKSRGGVARLESLYTGGYSGDCRSGYRFTLHRDKDLNDRTRFCEIFGNFNKCSSDPGTVAALICE